MPTPRREASASHTRQQLSLQSLHCFRVEALRRMSPEPVFVSIHWKLCNKTEQDRSTGLWRYFSLSCANRKGYGVWPLRRFRRSGASKVVRRRSLLEEDGELLEADRQSSKLENVADWGKGFFVSVDIAQEMAVLFSLHLTGSELSLYHF